MLLAVNELLRIPAALVLDEAEVAGQSTDTSTATAVKHAPVKSPDDTCVVRVLWISPDADDVVVMNIDQPKTMPTWTTKEQLRFKEDGGVAELLHDDPYLRMPPEDQISAKSRARCDFAWGVIAAMVRDEPAIYLRSLRGRLVSEAATKCMRPGKSIRRWLGEYWRGGMTKNTLLSNWENCGNRGQLKKAGTKKRGRPRTLTKTTGLNVDDSMRRLFQVTIENHYLGNAKASLESAYNTMLRKNFSSLVEEGKGGKLLLKSSDEIPTYEQFEYWYAKSRDLKLEANKRRGRVFYEKHLRPLLGNSTMEAAGPGARFQIDATMANVYLVSQDNPKRVVGRPIVYVVIDVWSRMIVGIYVGIEHASWTTAMMAIANAAADKVAFCAEYGIEITAAMWASHHVSANLLADRGEMEATLIERLISRLNITVENTPPYRADWKGIVERRFGILDVKYRPFIPGYIESDYKERGGHDYRLDATLNIRDFTKVMIHGVLRHNDAVIDGYPVQPDLVRDGVPSVPNELWAWGVKNRSGRLRAASTHHPAIFAPRSVRHPRCLPPGLG